MLLIYSISAWLTRFIPVTLPFSSFTSTVSVVKMLSGFAIDPEIEHFTFLGAYSEK